MTNRDTFHQLSLRKAALQGKLEALALQRKSTQSAVSLAKGRLLLQEEVTTLLKTLQTKAHEETVGLFNALLTSLLADVFPDTPPYAVKMKVSTRAGSPALDIWVENDKGKSEDLLHGNGGALTNTICMGLRFIAVHRSSRRNFLLLDEPDCWVEDLDRRDLFFKVVCDVAEQAGVQAVVITHAPLTAIPSSASVVKLVLDKDGVPAVKIIREGEEPGEISQVRLQNFRRHKDTTIPFSKGVTVITGANNRGKSAIASAIKAICEGETDDTMINHEAESFTVSLTVGEKVASITRTPKASPVVSFKLESILDEKDVLSGPAPEKNRTPTWIEDFLNIGPIEGLDVQLSWQKSPVFLLDESPATKAAILSIGREALYIAKMFDLYKKQVAEDKRTEKEGERFLKLTASADTLLSQVEALTLDFDMLAEQTKALEAAEKTYQQLEKIRSSLKTCQTQLNALAPLQSLKFPEQPVLQDISSLLRIQKGVKLAAGWAGLKLPELPSPPQLKDVTQLVEWQRKYRVIKAIPELTLPLLPEKPELTSVSDLQKMKKELERLQQQLNKLKGEEEVVVKELTELTKERDLLIEELGGICPTCSRPGLGEHAC